MPKFLRHRATKFTSIRNVPRGQENRTANEAVPERTTNQKRRRGREKTEGKTTNGKKDGRKTQFQTCQRHDAQTRRQKGNRNRGLVDRGMVIHRLVKHGKHCILSKTKEHKNNTAAATCDKRRTDTKIDKEPTGHTEVSIGKLDSNQYHRFAVKLLNCVPRTADHKHKTNHEHPWQQIYQEIYS